MFHSWLIINLPLANIHYTVYTTRNTIKNWIIWTRTVQKDNLGVPTSISFAEKINEGTLYVVQRTIFITARNYVAIYLTTVRLRSIVHVYVKYAIKIGQDFLNIQYSACCVYLCFFYSSVFEIYETWIKKSIYSLFYVFSSYGCNGRVFLHSGSDIYYIKLFSLFSGRYQFSP